MAIRIFWGTGSIGKKALQYEVEHGIQPDYFCDNDISKQNTYLQGILIISPEKMLSLNADKDIYITCAKYDEVYAQLLKLGTNTENIFKYNSLIDWIKNTACKKNSKCKAEKNQIPKILFELSNGLALGGIETWCINETTRLSINYPTAILVEQGKNEVMKVDETLLLKHEVDDKDTEYRKVAKVKDKILEYNPDYFIVDSPANHFLAACLAKSENPKISIIAVMHNDEEAYYSLYTEFEKCIDKLCVISEKFKNRMLQLGFPEEKIYYLPWLIESDFAKKNEIGSETCMHVGYAGRITKNQKRIDLLFEVIKEVCSKKQDIVFEIAGDGDYMHEFRRQICESNLENKIILHGMIPKEAINGFWKKQDLMVSCSDYEGHSITQCEAMANGVVPIVTDVSGARDDIIDSENGFVVEIGNIDKIVDKIIYLDEHRELLQKLSAKASNTIKEKYSRAKVEQFWNRMFNPSVSVIMPSLNVGSYIEECIDSVINQTLSDIEIICIDAGSTDGTYEILEEKAKQDKRITLLKSDVKSYGHQVNMGIKVAKGEYIAIVETDDYVEPDMYEELYKIARDTDADMVRADFDSFICEKDGKREFTRIRLFPNEDKNLFYGKIIDPRQITYLYTMDYNIWKGIYRRNFIVDNEITLNESKGAAFQDIGFSQLVHACAKKAYYTEKSFYRYRKDRDGSSINTVHGLEYAYQEFKRLIENENLKNKLVCLDGYYNHMSGSFITEYMKTIRAVNYDSESEHIEKFFTWFKNQLTPLLDRKDFWNEENVGLKGVLVDVFKENYVQELKRQDAEVAEERKKLSDFTVDRNIIVFGVGNWGGKVVRSLRECNANIVALTDNNEELWETQKYNLPIISPEKCVKKFAGCGYVIANKNHAEDIKGQLLEYRIEQDDILVIDYKAFKC